MSELLAKKCIPCDPPAGGGSGTRPFERDAAEALLTQVPGWALAEDTKRISRSWKFNDFAEAMQFVNKVAAIAEAEGHHPDIAIYYNKVDLSHTTHAVGGLTENDFILAAKISALS